MVSRIENLFSTLSKEIETEYSTTGKINCQKLKVLLPFYVGAKERFFLNIEKMEEIEHKQRMADRDLLFGSHPVLKDPMARERVRKAFLAIMDIGYKKSLELEAIRKKHGGKKEMEVEHACKETNEILCGEDGCAKEEVGHNESK